MQTIETENSLPETEQIRRGELIAEVLQLRRKRDSGRYDTTWGNKTALGLFLTVKRLVEEGV